MPDLWENDPATDDEAFTLPGDEEFLAGARAHESQPSEQPPAESGPAPADEPAAATGERPRDPETGRYVAKPTVEGAAAGEQPGGETAAAAETAPEAEPTLEQLQAKLALLEQRLADKDDFIGRQSGEIGQLRRAIEERMAGLEHAVSQPRVDSWDDLIDENPAQAAELAYRHGDVLQLRRAAQAWEQASPGAPKLWAQTKHLEERLARVEQAGQQAVEGAAGQEWARAYDTLVAEHPDLEDYIDDMKTLAPEFPELFTALEQGEPAAKARALRGLYEIARHRKSGTLAETAATIARRASEEEQRVREEAAVASATRTNTETPPDGAVLVGKQWEAMDAKLDEGWNI